jgi:Flp pilus assembly protein TadB
MTLPLLFLAVTVACLAYWAAPKLPSRLLPRAPRPAPRLGGLFLLDELIRRDLEQAQLQLPPAVLINLMLAGAAAGALLAWPFRSGILMAVAAGALGLAPYRLVRVRIGRRNRAIAAAVRPALIQIAKLCEVRHHPLLALADAMPLLDPPLKAELAVALAEAQAGLPLPDALRGMAERCCGNFYLHQLAELVALNIRSGGDIGGSLEGLAARLATQEELQAEETAALFGYKWLTRLLFGAALLPLAYWAVVGSGKLQIFVQQPVARLILIWVVLSGLAITVLPYLLAIDE